MATFSAACAAELERWRPGTTQAEFDHLQATTGEEPADYRRAGYPCLAAYVEAGHGVGSSSGGLLVVGLIAVGAVWAASRAGGNVRGLRGLSGSPAEHATVAQQNVDRARELLDEIKERVERGGGGLCGRYVAALEHAAVAEAEAAWVPGELGKKLRGAARASEYVAAKFLLSGGTCALEAPLSWRQKWAEK